MLSKCMSSLKIQFLLIATIMSLISFVNTSVEQLIAFCGKTLIICFISYLMTIFIKKFRTKELVTSKGKAVLITGISNCN